MRHKELRIVLLGKTGAGKSATGNTILGRQTFKSELSASSVTSQCEKQTGNVGGRQVEVIDTPGLFDSRPKDDVTQEIMKCFNLVSLEPHLFLVVIKLGSFSQEEQNTVKIIQENFGPEFVKYSMVLFIHGDELQGKTIEQFISSNEELAEYMNQYQGKYHVFNNKDTRNRSQVSELLEKIDKMITMNRECCYTKTMFTEAQKKKNVGFGAEGAAAETVEGAAVETVEGAAVGTVVGAVGAVGTAVGAVVGGLGTVVEAAVRTVVGAVGAVGTAVGAVVGGVGTVVGAAVGAVEGAVGTAMGVEGAAVGAVEGAVGTAVGVEGAAVETVEGAAVETVEGAAVGTVEGAAVETVEGAAVGTVEGAAVETVEGAAVETVEGTAVVGAVGAIGTAVGAVVGGVGTVVGVAGAAGTVVGVVGAVGTVLVAVGSVLGAVGAAVGAVGALVAARSWQNKGKK